MPMWFCYFCYLGKQLFYLGLNVTNRCQNTSCYLASVLHL